jgi:phosphatidate phosphatase APP1
MVEHSPELAPESSADDHDAWRRRLRQLARDFAGMRRNIKRRLGLLAPLRIAMYGGYGTDQEMRILGRVLEEREGAAPSIEDGPLSNFKRSFRQFESDEVANVELEIQVLSAPNARDLVRETARVVTDEDGYFILRHRFATRVEPGWLPVQARATAAPYPVSELPTAECQVLIPSPGARFGVISDIDDTILRTYVRNRARMLYLTLAYNPLTRLSFDGTMELYRGLRECGNGAPFFYVSKSMWNLFPLLDSFIAHQRLPRGPLILRQVGLFTPRQSIPHKANVISELLELYPRLEFILIGDSGERDLDLYLAAARANPGRIPIILIRNVSPVAQHAALHHAAQQNVPPGCRVLVFEDTAQAIALCSELGYWAPAPPKTLPPPSGMG